jgi:Ca-activated chloride channel family protein
VAAKPRDIVFVLDRSGSMAGWKMVAARRAAARMIDTLTSRDRFCAIAFDHLSELVPASGLVEATDRNRFRAVEALAKIEARGSTEIAEPLRLALGMLVGGTTDRERVIMLVTDGQVGNERQILHELAPTLRNIKMFTLGIDQAVNAAFLRQLAAAGGGLCDLVESEDRLDAVMAKVHRRIGTPLATELALRATGIELDRATLAPAKLPDVYAGAPVVVLGRFRGTAQAGATIDVEGTSLGEPLKLTVAASIASPPTSWLAASWARAHLRDLEDRYAVRASGDLEHQIVQVSKQFSVLSRFTAFLAVDRSQVVNRGGVLHQVVQAVERPRGWDERRGAAKRGGGMTSGPPSGGPLGAPAAARAGGAAPPPRLMASQAAEPMSVRRAAPMMREVGPPMRPAPAAPSAPSAPSPSSAQVASYDKVLPVVAVGSPAAVTVYLKRLAQLAVELDVEAKGAASAGVIRRLRQRLVDWSEDVRSTGLDELADAVDLLVQRLSEALAQPTIMPSDVIAIADSLTVLAAEEHPPAARPDRPLAFWK